MTKSSVINDISLNGLPDGTKIIEPITDERHKECTLVIGSRSIEVFVAAELRRFLQRTMQWLPEDSTDADVLEAVSERLGGFYDLALEQARNPAESKRIESHRDQRRSLLRQMLRPRHENRLHV